VVSDLIFAVSSRVTWATNSLDACFATNPAIDSVFLFTVWPFHVHTKVQNHYTVRPFDEDTQLQNNLNRWYDARVGRWLSEDPIGFTAGDGNLYRYVGNRPTGLRDADGLWGRPVRPPFPPSPPPLVPPPNPNLIPPGMSATQFAQAFGYWLRAKGSWQAACDGILDAMLCEQKLSGGRARFLQTLFAVYCTSVPWVSVP